MQLYFDDFISLQDAEREAIHVWVGDEVGIRGESGKQERIASYLTHTHTHTQTNKKLSCSRERDFQLVESLCF